MGIKINDLTAATSIKASDVLPISQDNGSGGRSTLKVNMQQVAAYAATGVSGGITSVGVISDGSLGIIGSPLVANGNIHVSLSSVSLDKLSNTGATDGDVIKYNGSTSTWVASAAGANGAAGGDLSGTYPNPTVAKIQGVSVSNTTPTNGQVLTYNGSTATWMASAAPINSGSSALTLGTLTTFSNQTSVTVTGIPSWAKRVTVIFNNMSTNGVSFLLLQVGSGSITTSGYNSLCSRSYTPGGPSTHTSTAGFNLPFDQVVFKIYGSVVLTLQTGNTWVCSGNTGALSIMTIATVGSVALAGALDRIRIITENGIDQFDGGTMNIMWE